MLSSSPPGATTTITNASTTSIKSSSSSSSQHPQQPQHLQSSQLQQPLSQPQQQHPQQYHSNNNTSTAAAASSPHAFCDELCDGVVTTRRGLLALLWSLVMIGTAVAFLAALFYVVSAAWQGGDDDNDDQNNNNQQQNDGNNNNPELAVTYRAMAFAASWTAVLAALLSVLGTVIWGWQSPLTGEYYTCCSSSVFRTTPLAVGSFVGLCIMFANLTLVCSVFFGEFQVKDFQHEEQNNNAGGQREAGYYGAVERSSVAFSIMCMFLTILYATFAAIAFTYSSSILEEHEADARQEAALLANHHHHSHRSVLHYNGYDGYIGERFDVLGVRRMPDIIVGERLDVRRIPGNTFVTNAPDGIV